MPGRPVGFATCPRAALSWLPRTTSDGRVWAAIDKGVGNEAEPLAVPKLKPDAAGYLVEEEALMLLAIIIGLLVLIVLGMVLRSVTGGLNSTAKGIDKMTDGVNRFGKLPQRTQLNVLIAVVVLAVLFVLGMALGIIPHGGSAGLP